MSSYIFKNVKKYAAIGKLNFNNGIYRVALCTHELVDTPKTYWDKEYWSDINEFEITNVTGYPNDGYETTPTAPGHPLQGIGVVYKDDAGIPCDDGLEDILVYANDVSYNISHIKADCAVIMKKNISGQYELICAIDIRVDGQSVISNNGVFKLLFSEKNGGFLVIK